MSARQSWNNLLQYGTGLAAILVITLSGIVMMAVVAIATVLYKISAFIK